MRLYRGIGVPVSSVGQEICTILDGGLPTEQDRITIEQSFGLQIESVLNKPDLSRDDTEPKSLLRPATYACGTPDSAARYAWYSCRESHDRTPLIIEFDAKITDLRVDGKDFLYTVFQGGCPDRASDMIRRVFGEKVLTYAQRAWNTDCTDRKVAYCDLATMDSDVIKAHYANSELIGGRGSTIFRNAFLVALPVLPENIVNVVQLTSKESPQVPSIRLGDCIGPSK